MKLTIDFETRSAVDLSKTGPYPYAEHPSTSVMCLAFKEDNQPPRIWLPEQRAMDVQHAIDEESHGGVDVGDVLPLVTSDQIRSLITRAEQIEAHNVQFELAIWHHVMRRKFGFPDLPMHKLRDTAAVAAMHALPRKLEQVCQVLRLTEQKDMEGHALMLKMSKPRAPRKDERKRLDEQFSGHPVYEGMKEVYAKASKEKLAAMCRYATRNWVDEVQDMLLWNEDPEDIVRLCQYCLQDVQTEYALSQQLGDLPPQELKVFQHDLVVNTRGVQVDLQMARSALQLVDTHNKRLLAEMDGLTSGLVKSPKQNQVSRDWLATRGVKLGDLKAETVKAALKGELPEEARRFLEIRQSLSKSSTAKYEAAINQTCSDGRLRGFSMYHGAGTGRWTGKGIQLQNLPKGIFDLEKPVGEAAFWHAVDLVKLGGYNRLVLEFGDPMPILSSVIRPTLIAGDGFEMHAADFSAIEGRGLAWLAGEEWVLDAYRAYDTYKLDENGQRIPDGKGGFKREGPDMYIVTASKILGIPVEQVTKAQRKNPGKPGDLGCFGPDTRVLTSNGVKRIEDVTTSDQLWDGVEWVRHDGLIEKGVKEVIDLCGIEVTPDHLIKTGTTWKQACRLVSNASTLCQALVTGSENLPSSALKGGVERIRATTSPLSKFSAHVVQSLILCMKRTFAAVNLQGVMPAQKKPAGTGGRSITPTQTYAQMKSTEEGCLTAYPRASGAATILTSSLTQTMEAEESTSMRLGASIDGLFYHTLSHLKDGIIRLLSSTASMWTKAMSQVTCALSPSQKMQKTKGLFNSCSEGLKTLRPVYDILNSGARNCFTIYSDRGPLIVHNCGYQGGFNALSKFNASVPHESRAEWIIKWIRRQINKPKLHYAAEGYEDEIKHELEIEKLVQESFESYISTLGPEPKEEHLTPLRVQGWPYPTEAELFEIWGRDVVDKWRASRPKTVALWRGLEKAAIQCVDTGLPCTYGPVTYRMEGMFCTCELPSGRKLYYPFPKIINREMPWGGNKLQFSHMTVDAETKQWIRRFAHGGLLTENCFTADTLVVTPEGAKSIVDILPGELVWDGEGWVCTKGPVQRGERRVVEWLGVRVTPDHLITDGTSWKAVSTVDEHFTQDALRWAQYSVASPSFKQLSEKKIALSASASVETKCGRQPEICTGVKALCAEPAGMSMVVPQEQSRMGTEISSKTKSFSTCGATDTQAWYRGALTRTTKHSQIMAGVEYACLSDGSTTEKSSLDTQRLFQGGTNSGLTSTESTTTGITAPEMSGSLKERSTPGTGEQTPLSSAMGKGCLCLNSTSDTAPNGKASTAYTTTSKCVDAQKIPLRHTEKAEVVYDLLECGPNHRFTILTSEGPLVVHNCTQAVCRDLLAEALLRLESAGFPIIMHVHDEAVAEVKAGARTLEEFEQIMTVVPAWAEGFPISAAGWSHSRYHKD